MKKIILFMYSFYFAISVQAASSAQRSAEAFSSEATEREVVAQLKEGFHFNEKAPHRIHINENETREVLSFSAREIRYELPEMWSVASSTFYICDDANTFCEAHEASWNAGFVPTTPGSTTAPKKVSTHKNRGRVNHHGFIEDDLPQALETAKKRKKLVIIDFSARWCPGCVRLEKEVFESERFKKLGRDYVKVKIDMDRFENIVIADKFHVKAIPTLLVLNADQQEINRVVDYQPLSRIESFFADIKKDSTPIQVLKEELEKAEKTDESKLLLLGQRLVVANQFHEALKVFDRLSAKPLEYWTAKPLEYWTAKVESVAVDYKNDKSLQSRYIKTLKEAIAVDPKSFRSLDWRTRLVGELSDKKEKEVVAAEGVAFADELLASPEKRKTVLAGDIVGEFTGYETLLIAMLRADLIDSAGMDAKEAWKKAADVGRSLKITARQSGPAVRYLFILTSAQLFEEANKLAMDLLRRNPNDGDVQRRRLRVLVELKKFGEAIPLGKKAIKNSYERNEFWVAELLAKAYIGASKKEEAKLLLDQYLARTDVNWPNMKETRAKLEELRKKL
ncbi:MAG: thioredoxin family protein [Bdellovibrionales bacterium]